MANLSLREAVKSFNVSRPTLTKSLNSGKLSGVRNGKGQWEIDPAELSRVYHPRKEEVANPSREEQVETTTSNSSSAQEIERLKADLALAMARAEAAEILAQERAERIEDLRRMLPFPSHPKQKSRFFWPWSNSR